MSRSFLRCLTILMIAGLALVTAAAWGEDAADPNQLREWSDRTGKFKIMARFKVLRGDDIVLENSAGKEVAVPLAKLSDADVKLAKELNEKLENSNPFAGLTPTGGAASPGASADSDAKSKPNAGTKKILKANWSGVKNILQRRFVKWTFEPRANPVPAAKVLGQEFILEDVPDSNKSFEKSRLFVSQDGSRAIISRINDFPHPHPNYLNEVDLRSKRLSALIKGPPNVNLVDARPEDGLLLFESKGFAIDGHTLGVGKLEDGKLIPLVTWTPYATDFFKQVQFARFISRDRLITMHDMENRITVWDFAKAKAVMEFKSSNNNGDYEKICLSDDRRLLAMRTDEGIAIIDLEKGAHVANLPLSDTRESINALAFNDDGSRFAASMSSGIFHWDLQTGKREGPIAVWSWGYHDQIFWCGDYILAGGVHVIDPKRRILLWEFSGDLHFTERKSDVCRRGKRWLLQSSGEKSARLIVGKVPNAGMLSLESSLGTPDEFEVAKAGSEVSIELELDPGTIDAEEARRGITDAANKAGWNVVGKSNLVVKAVCQKKPEQKIKINTSKAPSPGHPGAILRAGQPKPEDIVEKTITPHATYLTVLKDGKPVWNKGYLAQPGMVIYLEKDETIDQALARLTKPNVELLKNPTFPAVLVRPGTATSSGAYGTSPFSADTED